MPRHAGDKLAMYYDIGNLMTRMGKISDDIMLGQHHAWLWDEFEKAEVILARMKGRLGKHRPDSPPTEYKKS